VTNQVSGAWRTTVLTVPGAAQPHRQDDRADSRIGSAGPVAIGQVTAGIRGPGTPPVDLRDR
jgi:hypothetical protein